MKGVPSEVITSAMEITPEKLKEVNAVSDPVKQGELEKEAGG